MPLPKMASEYEGRVLLEMDKANVAEQEDWVARAALHVARAQVHATILLAYEQAETNRLLRNRFRIPEE